jgi:hypothetical protein
VEPADFFSSDYATARSRFRSTAQAAGATLDALTLDARGPAREELTIDIAWLGPTAAERVLLHTCGLHGVEAFAGSAVQLAALASPPARPEGCALVLVHVLNPYGMAWLRRVNETNVDLNRNFLGPGERRTGAPALYAQLDPLLNPTAAPGRREPFQLKLAAAVLRHGCGQSRRRSQKDNTSSHTGCFTAEPGSSRVPPCISIGCGKTCGAPATSSLSMCIPASAATARSCSCGSRERARHR